MRQHEKEMLSQKKNNPYLGMINKKSSTVVDYIFWISMQDHPLALENELQAWELYIEELT